MHSVLLPIFYKATGHAMGIISAGGLLAGISFLNQVTTGTALVGAVILILAGLFTVRSKIASVWREEAEGEKAKALRLERELKEERADRAKFEREQLEARHDLKEQIAHLQSQIKLLEAKTDLMAAVESVKQMNVIVVEAVTAALRDGLEQRDGQTHSLLTEIRDRLPAAALLTEIRDRLPAEPGTAS